MKIALKHPELPSLPSYLDIHKYSYFYYSDGIFTI